MSFLSSGTTITSNLASRYQTDVALFSAGGTPDTTSGYVGRYFQSGGTLTVSKAGRYMALVVDAGNNGDFGWFSSLGKSPGDGGAGGGVRVIYGFLSLGNYTVQIFTGAGQTTNFSGTTTSTVSFTPGTGGTGWLDAFGYEPIRPATSGGNGPTINIAPFTSISASGGGGGATFGTAAGQSGTKSGGGAQGLIGGIVGGNGGTVSLTSTTYGGGGGGGYAWDAMGALRIDGGIGGPGFFWIVGHAPEVTSNVSSGTQINTYFANGYLLSDVLSNYFYSVVNPNTSLVTAVNSDINYLINGTTFVSDASTNLGIGTHPFLVTGSLNNYRVNYFNGFYTIIFPNNGIYTVTFSSAITNLVAYVCSAGGDGASNGAGQAAAGGGSGIVTRGTLASLPSGAILTCSANQSSLYRVSYSSSNITATNGSNGNFSVTGNDGSASSAGSDFTAINSSLGVTVTPTFTVTISNATPAVVTRASHGLVVGDSLSFSTTGALPTGITAGTVYFIISAGFTTSAFRISLTSGGAAINTTSVGSGTHTGAARVITKFGTTPGGYVMYTNSNSAIGFGGRGGLGGFGGKNGIDNANSTTNGSGYGAGGGGNEPDLARDAGVGALGVIILSFPF